MKQEVNLADIAYPAKCSGLDCDMKSTQGFEVIINKDIIHSGYVFFKCKKCGFISKVPQ